MTIEEALARQALNLGRIADALEAIATSQGIVSGETPPEPVADEQPTTKKKATKKKASKKKAAKKTTVGKKKEAEAETELTIKDDVRPVMKRLRAEVSHAAVKSLLKAHGASTMQQLDPGKFQSIIDAALEELGEDPDDLGLDDDDL